MLLLVRVSMLLLVRLLLLIDAPFVFFFVLAPRVDLSRAAHEDEGQNQDGGAQRRAGAPTVFGRSLEGRAE